MASSTEPATWSWLDMPTLDSIMKPKQEAEQALTYFFLLCWNGPVLTITQIMRYIVSSAPEAEIEMTALFLTAKEMVPFRHTLTEMGWKQPPSPLQSDNSTAVGMANCTLIPHKSKS